MMGGILLMPYANSVVGGGGNLVRKQIKSPNFVTGVSGWIIRKDGTAEFQNIVARGDIQATTFHGTDFEFTANGEFFYKAAAGLGTLILSITPDNYVGTDGHGNTVVGGTTSYVDNGVSFDAVNFQGGSLNFFNSPTANGAYTLGASILMSTPAAMSIVTQLANGDITIGPAATGTVFFPAGTDPIVANKSGAAETWQDMAVRGYQNSWSNSGGANTHPGRFRLIPSPANMVQLQGSLFTPATPPNGQVIVNLPNAYHPSGTINNFSPRLICPGDATVQARLNITSGGNLQIVGAATLAVNTELIIPDCTMYSLD